MALEISNIILTNAVARYAPYGTAPVSDSLALGATWPSPWTAVGFTGAPLTFGYEYQTIEADVQESLGSVNVYKTKESLAMETTLMEFDVTVIPLAWEGTGSVTPAASGVTGVDVYNVGGKNFITKRAWAFEGGWVNAQGQELPIRVYIWRAAPSGGSGLEFSKEKYVGFPLKLMALSDLTKPNGERFFQIRKVSANALP